MYKDFVSDEPLDVIRANECQHPRVDSVATTRFRRLFNEIEKLQAEVERLSGSADGTT